MAPPTSRADILEGLRASIDQGKIIVGAGAGQWKMSYPSTCSRRLMRLKALACLLNLLKPEEVT